MTSSLISRNCQSKVQANENPEHGDALGEDFGATATILRNHRTRNFGWSGFRQVQLSVYNDDIMTFQYVIQHIWFRSDASCASLFQVKEPKSLIGTRVLSIEWADTNEMKIWLRLRTAKNPVEVSGSRSRQCVLGTDFTYEDLRFWVPVEGLKLCQAVAGTALGRATHVLAGTRQKSTKSVEALSIHFDVQNYSVVKHVSINPATDEINRIYQAENFVSIFNIDIPKKITITRPTERYSSVMHLQKISYDVDTIEEYFRPDALANCHLDFLDQLASNASSIV